MMQKNIVRSVVVPQRKESAATVRVIKDSTVNDVVCIAGVLVFREMGCLDDCEVVPAPS
mgnify:CR=1 FL=1